MMMMTELRLYPGSKTPVRTVAHTADPDPEWDISVIGRPVSWYAASNSERHYLYSTGQLAKALNRSAVTIRLWETDQIIPLALWRKAHRDDGKDVTDPRGFRRYYSESQVIGMRRIAAEEGILDNKYKSIRATNFTARVKELWLEDA